MKTFLKYMVTAALSITMCFAFAGTQMVMADPVDGNGTQQEDGTDDTGSEETDDDGEIILSRDNRNGSNSTYDNPYEDVDPIDTAWNDAYIVVYQSGVAVVQQYGLVDSTMGAVQNVFSLSQWTDGNNYNNTAQTAARNIITTIVFKDNIQNASGAYFFANIPNLTEVVHAERLKLTQVNSYARAYMMFAGTTPPAAGFEKIDVSGLTNLNYLFYHATLDNLDFASSWNTSNITSMTCLFYDAHDIHDMSGLSSWDVSHVTDMSYLFYMAKNIDDTSGMLTWNTANVTNMKQMFYLADNVNLNGLANFSFAKVTSFVEMFYNAKNIDTTPLADWDTSTITNMSSMFRYSDNINFAGVEDWDVSNVTNMAYLFAYAKNFDLTHMSSWSPSKVTTMAYMFSNTQVDITPIVNWNTASLTNMDHMFASATCNIPSTMAWDTSKVKNMSYVFSSHTSVTFDGYDGLANWDTSSATNMSYMFDSSKIVTTERLASWNTSNVTNMSRMFYNTGIKNLDGLTSWNVSNVKNFMYTFNSCTALKTAHLNWTMSSATTVEGMFRGDKVLTEFTNESAMFQMPNLSTMNDMFYDCRSLTDISGMSKWSGTTSLTNMTSAFTYTAISNADDLANLDTSNVTSLDSIFSSCKNLSDINALSSWNTGKVTNLSWSFNNCILLTDLNPLASWNVGSVTSMSSTFSGCTALADVSAIVNWNTENCKNMNSMFSGTKLATTAFMANWDTSKVTNFNSMFSNCLNLTVVDLTGVDFDGVSSITYASFSNCPNVVKIIIPNDLKALSNLFSTNWGYFWKDDDEETLYDISTVMSSYTAESAGTYYRRLTCRLSPMGGTLSVNRNIYYTVKGYTTPFPEPTWDGHTFLGWYDSTGTRRTSINPNEVLPALYARWEESSYTLKLDPNMSGVSPVTITMATDDPYTFRSDVFPSVTNYYIDGWSTEPNGEGTRYAIGDIVLPQAATDAVVTYYPIWIDNVDIPVQFVFVDIATGERISTTDTTVLCGRTCTEFDPMPELPEGYTIAYISTRDDLDAVSYNANPDAYKQYENDYTWTFPAGENSPGTVYYNSYTNEIRSTFFDNTHVYTTSDANTVYYAYVIKPLYFRIHFMPNLQDNLDNLEMTLNGESYSDGELVIPYARSYNGQNSLFGSYAYGYTPNYYLLPIYNSSNPANNFYDVYYAIKNAGYEFNYDFLTLNANYYYADSYNINEFYYYSDPTDYHRVFYPDNNYLGNTWTYNSYKSLDGQYWYMHPGDTLDYYVGACGTIQLDYQYDGIVSDTTVYLGSGYNPNPRGTSINMTPSRDGYSFIGWSTEPDQYGTDGYDEANLVYRGNDQLKPVDLVTMRTLYAIWQEDEGGQGSGSTDFSNTRYLTVYNDGAPGSPYIVTKSNGETLLTNLREDRVFYGNTQSDYVNHYFVGWFTEPNGQGEQLTNDSKMPDEDMSIYAYWTSEHYTIYYNVPDHQSTLLFAGKYRNFYNSTTGGYNFPVGGEITSLMIPSLYTDDNVNFLGWFDIEGNQLQAGDKPADGTIYYARWATEAEENLDFNYSYSLAWSSGGAYRNDDNGTVQFSFSVTAAENDVIPANAVDIVVPFNPSSAFSTTLKVGDFFVYYNEGGRYHLTNPNPITGEAGFNVNLFVDSQYGTGIRELPFSINIDKNPDDEVVDVHAQRSLFMNYATSSVSPSNPTMRGTGYRDAETGDIVVTWTIDTGWQPTAAAAYVNMTPTNMGVVENEGFDINNTHYDGAGRTIRLTVRYPASSFDPEAQSATITETARITYAYASGGTNGSNVTSTATVEWIESPLNLVYLDGYRNAGRAQNDYGRGSSISNGTNPHVYSTQRQFATIDSTIQYLTWWQQYGTLVTLNGKEDGYISVSIGDGDIYYNPAVYDDYYRWNPSAGQIALTEDEFTISSIRVYDNIIWTQEHVDEVNAATGKNYTTDNMPRTTDVEVWVRYRGANEFVLLTSNSGLNYNNDTDDRTGNNSRKYNHGFYVDLPKNVVEVEVRSPNEDGMYYHEVDFTYTIKLVPTARIQNLINIDYTNNVNSVFKPDACSGVIYNSSNGGVVDTTWRYSDLEYDTFTPDGTPAHVTWDEDCGLLIFELKSDVSNRYLNVETSASSVTTGSSSQTATFSARMYTYGAFSGDYQPMTDGVMYILLPKETQIGTPSVYSLGTRDGQSYSSTSWYNHKYSIDASKYSIDYVENWNNTGRDLMIITFHDVDTTGLNVNGIEVSLPVSKSIIDLRYNNISTYADFSVLGINMTDDVVEYASRTYDPFSESYWVDKTLRPVAQANMDWVDRMAVNSGAIRFNAESITQYGFTEYIANSSANFGPTAQIFPCEDYYYEYIYSHNAAGQNVNDLFFTADLDGLGLWRGISATTLEAQTSDGTTITVTPVIWYNLNETPDFAHVDAEHGWTTTEPTENDIVHGLAMDYRQDNEGRDAIITGAAPVLVMVKQNMTAAPGTTFESTGTSHVNQLPENNAINTTATVNGEVVNPNLSVELRATPESGSADYPTQVKPDDSIVYSMIVRNGDNRNINNVVVENPLPAGVSVSLADITVGYNKTPITEATGISNVSLNDGKLVFTIDTLYRYGSVSVDINTVAGQTPGVITDTAYITSYNGYDISANPFTSETTYHEIIGEGMPDPTGIRSQIMPIVIFASLMLVGGFGFIIWTKKSKKKPESENEAK